MMIYLMNEEDRRQAARVIGKSPRTPSVIIYGDRENRMRSLKLGAAMQAEWLRNGGYMLSTGKVRFLRRQIRRGRVGVLMV